LVTSAVLNASRSIATPATAVRIFPTLAITWPQRPVEREVSIGGGSGEWHC
jgi:hypothetical protein